MNDTNIVFVNAEPGAGSHMWARTRALTMPTSLGVVDSYAYRVAGLVRSSDLEVPFRAPHHTVSEMGMFGSFSGGYRWRPGEVSLASGGVLLLDDVTEVRSAILGRLKQCMKTGFTYVGPLVIPVTLNIIAIARSCPCGYRNSHIAKCSCSKDEVARHTKRVPLWLLAGERVNLPVRELVAL